MYFSWGPFIIYIENTHIFMSFFYFLHALHFYGYYYIAKLNKNPNDSPHATVQLLTLCSLPRDLIARVLLSSPHPRVDLEPCPGLAREGLLQHLEGVSCRCSCVAFL